MSLLKKMIGLTAIASVVLATGCASILNDKTQKVNVTTSNGSKITASVDGQSFAVPGIVDLTRSKTDKTIITSNSNCNPQTLAPKQVDSMFWINILSGGAFGSTTDYSTEKMWKYNDNLVISCK
ncbi:hypothetical protein [Aquirhabdus sp.]|uniref:hypothetical protein n=1 Tax=Aquirhabdus sp. TaxID=2824160 RepID=UPI00396C565C